VKRDQTTSRRRRAVRSRCAVGDRRLAAPGQAADWRPTENVRLIVPAAAGGTTDVMGRLLAAHLQTAWGQSAIVENRSGGGGTIGTAEAVRQKGDGKSRRWLWAGVADQNGVSVALWRTASAGADGAAPAGPVLHDRGLAPRGLQMCRQQSSHHIRGAPRGGGQR